MRPKYREIIRLAQPDLKLSQEKIAASCNASKGTVNKVLKLARERQLSWPLPESYTDQAIAGILYPEKNSTRQNPTGKNQTMSTYGKNCCVMASTRNFSGQSILSNAGCPETNR